MSKKCSENKNKGGKFRMADLTKLTKLEALKQLAERVRDGYVANKDFKVVEDKVTKLEGDVSGLQSTVTELEDQLGDENVIEGVKVNGANLTLDEEKKVNVTITESETNGKISVNGSDVTVHGLNAMAYKENVAETDLTSELQTKINSKADDTDLDALEAIVTTLVGQDASKSVRKIATEEIAAQLIAAEADGSMDSLEELAAWFQSHPKEVGEINKKINDLVGLVGEIPEDAEADDVVSYIREVVVDAITELNMSQYAKSADVTKEIEEALESYLTEDDLEDYVTETQLNNMIATDTEVTEMLNSVFGTNDVE